MMRRNPSFDELRWYLGERPHLFYCEDWFAQLLIIERVLPTR